MKALTIKEPWASLIINGYKEYEFRSWKTNYRGKILIHAGLSLEKENATKFKDYNLDYGHGEIIGEAYLDDCVLIDENMNKELLKKDSLVYGASNHSMKYGFHLTKIKKYKNRIPCKGKLGLWDCKEKM
jgi:activating signal cointegrator 1